MAKEKVLATTFLAVSVCYIASLLGNYLSNKVVNSKPWPRVSKLSAAINILFIYTVKRALSGLFLALLTESGSEKITYNLSSSSVRDVIFQLYSIFSDNSKFYSFISSVVSS